MSEQNKSVIQQLQGSFSTDEIIEYYFGETHDGYYSLPLMEIRFFPKEEQEFLFYHKANNTFLTPMTYRGPVKTFKELLHDRLNKRGEVVFVKPDSLREIVNPETKNKWTQLVLEIAGMVKFDTSKPFFLDDFVIHLTRISNFPPYGLHDVFKFHWVAPDRSKMSDEEEAALIEFKSQTETTTEFGGVTLKPVEVPWHYGCGAVSQLLGEDWVRWYYLDKSTGERFVYNCKEDGTLIDVVSLGKG